MVLAAARLMRLRMLRNLGATDVAAGELWIENGELKSDREDLVESTKLVRLRDKEGRELTPADGDAFLEALHKRHGANPYFRTVAVRD